MEIILIVYAIITGAASVMGYTFWKGADKPWRFYWKTWMVVWGGISVGLCILAGILYMNGQPL